MLVVLLVVVALIAGLVAAGSLRALEHLRIHWWGVAIVGLALQIAPFGDGRIALASLVVSYGFLLGFVWVNRRLPAAPLLLLGLALNLAVVASNAGMPVSPAAAHTSAGGRLVLAEPSGIAKHHLGTDADVLTPLGDVIPLPPPLGIVLSVGDLFIYGGIACLLVSLMIGRSGENRRPPARIARMYRGKHLRPRHHPLRSPTPLPRVPAATARSGI
jgi:hypothetical protein